MTRAFIQQIEVQCPQCHLIFPVKTENPLSEWIRKNPKLPSTIITICDVDLNVHNHQTAKDEREIECMMEIEAKLNGGVLTESQRDTLHIKNQLIRNRRSTPTKSLKYQVGSTVHYVYSIFKKRKIICRHYGVHALILSGTTPLNSEWMKWDGKEINIDILEQLLLFNIDPDNLRPNDFRRHHVPRSAPILGLMDLQR